MDPKDVTLRSERVETDSSLRAEREKADEELARRGAEVDRDADDVVELARARADGLLEETRKLADASLTPGGGPAGAAGAAASRRVARISEDDAVSDAREAADDALEAERAAQRRAVLQLLTIEREETDERLLAERARSDRALATRDDFLAIVSHDVRGILAGMAMSAEVLARTPIEGPAGEVVHREAQRVRRLTARMNRLVGDLLDVVSMESGKLAVVPATQDAARLIAETMEGFHLMAVAKRIGMTSEVAPGPTRASFDHDRILQVLTNLVGNAMKFTKAGGAIALRLAPMEGGLLFTVRDDGCGIPADRIQDIFERFSQVSRVDSGGLGLGLYIAWCIVEAHGGKIWAESALGEGSAFHFTLPTG
jgi:signal transduction histidine kinase